MDARDFFYSRISMAMGDDIVLEILDRDGIWQYVNEYFAAIQGKKRPWFVGRSIFEQYRQISATNGARSFEPLPIRVKPISTDAAPVVCRTSHQIGALELERAHLSDQASRQPRWRGTERETNREQVRI